VCKSWYGFGYTKSGVFDDIDFIKYFINHELEHFLQFDTSEISQNSEEDLFISSNVGIELGAYLESNLDQNEHIFEDWWQNFFAKKFKVKSYGKFTEV